MLSLEFSKNMQHAALEESRYGVLFAVEIVNEANYSRYL